jgi:hypothetical protein
MKIFDKNNQSLINQFKNTEWIEESGVSAQELADICNKITKNEEGFSKCIIKAKTFAAILENSRIAIDKDDIFQDKIYDNKTWSGTLTVQRGTWQKEIINTYLSEDSRKVSEAYATGSYTAASDFGHTSPNSDLLIKIGFTGLLNRAYSYSKREGLSQKQKDFYSSVIITLEAIICFIKRLAKETEKINKENSIALYNIANDRPKNIYEAMQLIIIYFLLHEYYSLWQ